MKPVSLSPLLRSLEDAGVRLESPADLPDNVSSVADDSREVVAGSLFVAVAGAEADGHDFVPQAVGNGASVALVERKVESAIPQIVVSDSRLAVAIAASHWFGNPGRRLRMIGVTGTNGKTTTVSIIRHLVNSSGDVASLGTLGGVDGAGNKVEMPGLTTPGPIWLQGSLARLLENGVRTVAMEVSSHSLSQARVAGVEFDLAVFTNLTHEHLDYHRDLADYLDAKLKLVEYLKPDGRTVLNLDSTAWRQLHVERPASITFGTGEDAIVRARNLDFALSGTGFDMVIEGQSRRVDLPLLGEFNVSNALAAAASALAMGLSPEEIQEGLSTAPQIPGRMEILHSGEFVILRDYAHTPDAFERVLGTLRESTAGKLIILFGCGGDRDRKKRPVLAEMAARLTDMVFVTTDNPRTEDPARIFSDMEPGLAGRAYLKVDDRAEAIRRAVSMLNKGDTLLLAGKGHETYQIFGKSKEPFDEREIVAEALSL